MDLGARCHRHRPISNETDHPPGDSTWPVTQAYVGKLLPDVDVPAVERILRGNALDMPGKASLDGRPLWWPLIRRLCDGQLAMTAVARSTITGRYHAHGPVRW